MAKLKDLVKENFSIVGGVVSTPAIGNMDRSSSLTSIVEDMYGKTEKVSAKQIQQSIREFSSFSKVLQKEEPRTAASCSIRVGNLGGGPRKKWRQKMEANPNG